MEHSFPKRVPTLFPILAYMSEALKIQIKTLPNSPGVYQYYDKNEVLLYIGKAKNLKKRVASYFVKTIDNAKTRVLVSKIRFVKHIVVDTETDALLLENNLIKKVPAQIQCNAQGRQDLSLDLH